MAGHSTRRSARQVITQLVNTAVLKAEVCTAGIEPVHFQLAVYKRVAIEMGWTDLVNKIERVLKPTTERTNQC